MVRSARAALCPRRFARCLVRPLLALFAVLPFLILASFGSSAQAQYPGGGYPGSYDVTYSGGTYTQSSSGPPPYTYTYDDFPSYYDGSYGGVDHLGFYTSQSGLTQSASVSCDGTLTATLTWNNHGAPANLPPKSVVIQEDCTAWWTGSANSGGTYGGICNNPLGGQATGNAQSGQNWAHTRYSAKTDPGTSFTVTCTPTASAWGVSGSVPGGYGDCGAGVSYKVTATPLEVVLSGGIGDSKHKRYLIGQLCTATLSSGGLTPNFWDWSANGGEPFKDWTANQNQAVFTPLGSETGSQLTCHFKKPEPEATIICAAHLAVPAGASPSGGLDVTVDQDCSAERPDSASIGVEIGAVTPLPAGGPFDVVQLQRSYRYPPDGNAAGMEYTGEVITPSDYVNAYGSTGDWNWTQLITSSDQRKCNSVWEQLTLPLPPPASPPYYFINGLQCLDNTYPYDGWYPADGSSDGNADSPDEGLEADPLITAKDILDSFDDWFMYCPPGQDSVAVPLKKVNWYWEFHATKTSGLWSVSGTNAQWSFDGDYPAHPEWTFPLINQDLDYHSP